MKTSIVGLVMLMLTAYGSNAQTNRQMVYGNQVWVGDFTKVKLNAKWAVYLDCGARRSNWFTNWSQLLVRPGIIYNLNKSVSVAVGAAYFRHFVAGLVRNEYRPWEQITFTETIGRVSINHRLRAEQRFNQRIEENKLQDEFNYNNRFRYQLNALVAINNQVLENNTLYLTFAEELMINNGKEIKYNYFDQNRLSAGLGYKLNDALNVSIAYMNVFIQKNQALSFEQNNVVVFNLYHTVCLNKK